MNQQKYFLLGCCCLILGAITSAQSNVASTLKPNSTTYAVVIGLSKYQHPAMPPLTYADKDAAVFAAFLQSPSGGGVASEQVQLLQNEKATIAAIYDAFDWLKEHCKEDDLAYIYFAGHGDVETRDKFSLGYLLAYNSPNNNYRNNAIRIEDLNDCANFLTIKNKAKVVLITDACHSGKLAGDFYKGKQLAATHLKLVLNNEVRIASCAADEEAAEGPNWGGGRGVFSYHLLNGMYGLADLEKDGNVQLNELTKYLDSSFKNDRYLQQNQHQQLPVSSGHPGFLLAIVDASVTDPNQNPTATKDSPGGGMSADLAFLAPLALQPIDYFFEAADYKAIETILRFESYLNVPEDSLALALVNDCITFQQKQCAIRLQLMLEGKPYEECDYFNLDSLTMLQTQLLKNKSINKRFREKFIQLTHQLGQEMINAYLSGDLAELEKRQYYYSGSRDYNQFLSMLKLALRIVPPDHHLANLLKVHQQYLGGLIHRLQMVTSKNTRELLNNAFSRQQDALELEPYAAYIHNELGNLYLHKKNFDSADYHFNLATVLSPTWAVPWSNLVRLHVATNQAAKALQAVHTADSLQPNLSYVMVNAGLVMEKQKNWLGAISFYLKAIATNNVHFFPYERLGTIYTFTGDYQLADKYLQEAATRKNEFSLNDQHFEFGLELGGVSYGETRRYKHPCTAMLPDAPTHWQPFIKLWKALEMQEDSTADQSLAKQLLEQVLVEAPAMPMTHHYLGKQLVREGRWQQAIPVLRLAIAHQQPDSIAYQQLKNGLYKNGDLPTEPCLLFQLAYYRYDLPEDHYLLALALENTAETREAIQQYQIIARIENQRQLNQANYVGYPSGKLDNDDPESFQFFTDELMTTFEKPVPLIGSIKAARLHEQLGDYNEAEKILLQQVSLNRAAADARQAAITSRTPGTWQLSNGSKINFYWLNINRGLEIETYNFYQRITTLLPRDGDWKERAGLFLYQRLALSLTEMPVKEYAAFYASFNKYAYPWTGKEDGPGTVTLTSEIPGTASSVNIFGTVYNPFLVAIQYLQESVRLSGELQASGMVLEALADLNAWAGNSEAAIRYYKEAVSLQPEKLTLRNKLLNYLEARHELPAAMEQAVILQERSQLKPPQVFTLAKWQMLSGNYIQATKLLSQYKAIDNVQKTELVLLRAKGFYLANNSRNAIELLTAPLPLIPKVESTDENFVYYRNLVTTRWYLMARLYAQMKQPAKAMSALQQALNAGFNFETLLTTDTVWAVMNQSKEWKKMLTSHRFEPDNDDTNYTPNPINYWIPGYKNDYE